jgi:hypothetical protein
VSAPGPITGVARRALVDALARLLVADLRRTPASPPEAASGVAPSGNARTIVGRLHPSAVTSPAFNCSPGVRLTVVARR